VVRVEGGHDGSVAAALYREERLNWPVFGADAEADFDLNELPLWVFKCAERAAVLTAWWPEAYEYDFFVTPNSSASLPLTSTLNVIPPIDNNCAFVMVQDVPTNIPVAYLRKNAGSLSAPHGEFMTAYTLDGHPSAEKGIWVDAGCNFWVSVVNPFANELQIIFDAIEDSGVITNVVLTNSSTANPAILTMDFERAGYYIPLILGLQAAVTSKVSKEKTRFKTVESYRHHRTNNLRVEEYTEIAVDFNGMRITRAAASPVTAMEPLLRHLTLPDWETLCHSVNEIMVYAASLRYTNTSKLINKEGSWVAKVSRGKSWWTWQNAFNKLATASQMKDATLDEGFHGWVKPNNSNVEFVFRKFTSTLAGVILDTYAPVFDPEMPCLVVIPQVTDYSTQSAYSVLGWGVNYTTDSQWFNPKKSKYSHSEFESIMTVIESIPTCHNNPQHNAEITRAVAGTAKSLLSNVSQVAPEALQILELVGAFI